MSFSNIVFGHTKPKVAFYRPSEDAILLLKDHIAGIRLYYKAMFDLAEELGFKGITFLGNEVEGFSEPRDGDESVDMKTFRQGTRGGYLPRKSNKAGKALAERMQAVPLPGDKDLALICTGGKQDTIFVPGKWFRLGFEEVGDEIIIINPIYNEEPVFNVLGERLKDSEYWLLREANDES